MHYIKTYHFSMQLILEIIEIFHILFLHTKSVKACVYFALRDISP